MKRAEEIFAEASVLPPEEREAFLTEACGDDALLRLEVQRMFIDMRRARELFGEDDEMMEDGDEDLDGSPGGVESVAEKEGDRVGPYILRQQIGEGGFGTVWMAEQHAPISRMVALKVVKAGMDTKQVLARFEAERQALAIMDHPNIAKVLDAGATATGRPYFAMELVKGIPITEFCDQQKYDTRRRLELFRDVCSAVNHAHQKGIIHRDLKPSNVMVTRVADQPVPKVIDFGIAKATQSKLTDKTLFTRYEQFLGTPVYISPEQAALSGEDVDTRSDIYSLGVLLYELLAGVPPFDQESLLSAGYDEMRRMIREDDPPKPSTKLSQTQAAAGRERVEIAPSALKGELDWIVMKALEKDRTRRYETANAFSQDIAHYLADEPVLAAAPSTAYKVRKFARRHKAALGVAAGLALVFMTSTALSSWQAWRATNARNQSEIARQQAEEARKASESARQESDLARQEAESFYTFLFDALQRPNPYLADGDREVTVLDVLEEAESELATELADPERRMKLQRVIAETYGAMGRFREAIESYQKILGHYDDTGAPAHPEALEVRYALADTCAASGERGKAADITDEAFRLASNAHGEKAPLTLEAMTRMIRQRHDAGRTAGLEELTRDLIAACRETYGPQSLELIEVMHQMAHTCADEETHARHLQVVDLARRTLGIENDETLEAMECLAASHQSREEHEDALKVGQELLAARQHLSGEDHRATLSNMGILVRAYRGAGKGEEAMELGVRYWKLSYERFGEDHPTTQDALAQLGVPPGADGEAAARRFDFERAALEMMVRPTTSIERYAVVLLQLERYEEYAKLVAPELERDPESGPVHVYFLPPEADWRSPELIKRILVRFETPGSGDQKLRLGMGLYRLGDYAEAGRTLDEASKELDWRPHAIEAHAFRAMVWAKTGHPEEAESPLAKAKGLYLAEKFHPSLLPQDDAWPARLAAHLALKEALETIEGDSSWLPSLDEPPPTTWSAKLAHFAGHYGNMFALPDFKPEPGDALRFATALAYLDRQSRHQELAQSLLPLVEAEDQGMALDQFCKSIFLVSTPDGEVSELHQKAWEHFLHIRDLDPGAFEGRGFVRLDRCLGSYRVGNYDEVEQVLEHELATMSEGTPDPAAVYAFSVRAMSRWKLGKADLAIADLLRARSHYQRLDRRLDQQAWHDNVVIPHVLLREAMELIEGSSDSLPDLEAQAVGEVAETIVPAGSEWRWLHPTDGVDPAASDSDFRHTFYQLDYDDGAWKAGTDSPFGFGYGDPVGVDLGAPPEGRRYTAYFRCEFTTEQEHQNLELRCLRDDGIIVYLDGVEVARDNMQAGNEAYELRAARAIGRDAENAVVQIPLHTVPLPPGKHVLAISLHNANPNSTDLRIGNISLVETKEPSSAELNIVLKRPAGLDPRQIDLSDHYNASLYVEEGWTKIPGVPGGYTLANLPSTFEPRHGVGFDLRGILQLESGELPSKWDFTPGTLNERYGYSFPKKVEGIAVEQTAEAIHFLTSCQWAGDQDGAAIARFVMHFEDGTDAEMPVQIGSAAVRDWVHHGDNPPLEDKVIGWQGTNPAGMPVSLSELIWKNPHPEKVIKTIDFVSEESPHGAPFLVALTLE